MQIFKHPERVAWKEILSRPVIDTSQLIGLIKPILEEVRFNGDEAVRKYTREFDQVELDDLSVPESQINNIGSEVPESLKRAIDIARTNIERFHSSQKYPDKVITTTPGVNCWQKSEPIEKVGLYVPGGSAPLISTVLMLGIPAMLAGCLEIVLCTPPQKDGNIHPAILYTAQILHSLRRTIRLSPYVASGVLLKHADPRFRIDAVRSLAADANKNVRWVLDIVPYPNTAQQRLALQALREAAEKETNPYVLEAINDVLEDYAVVAAR